MHLWHSLNARKSLTNRSEGTGQGDDYPMPVVFPTVYSPGSHVAPWSVSARIAKTDYASRPHGKQQPR